MTSGVRFKLQDCSPELRKRLEASLARSGVQPLSPCGTAPKAREKAVAASVRVSLSSKSQPNKTEQAYNLRFLGGVGLYESISLRLPGGSRYTPDWVSVDGAGVVHLHEVKGSYKLPSYGRALVAWKEARAHFKFFQFHWCVWDGQEWREMYKENA